MKVRTIKSKQDSGDQAHPANGEYIVYAIEIYHDILSDMINKGKVMYCIKDSENYAYFDSSFFDIIDSRISKYWQIELHPGYLDFGLKEWIADLSFQNAVMHERVSDQISRFNELTVKIRDEFSGMNLPSAIFVRKENWIQCISCQNIWNNEINNAIINCPDCGFTMNNPSHENFLDLPPSPTYISEMRR